jgi:uncharacterized protein (TIGR02172 family)
MYLWKEGWILKLFHEWFPGEDVRYEAQIARIVHQAGLPVPAVGKVVEVEGRWGLIYEQVDGPTMLEEIRSKPWRLLRSARLLAELHADMHASDVQVELPSQRERLRKKIERARGLSADLQEAHLEALEEMPEGARLCHGDFHPDNVVITKRGPVVIDWIDATQGNPLADVARTTVILLGVRASRRGSWAQRVMAQWYHRLYVRRYFELQGGEQKEYRAWYPIVAAARMSEGIGELEEWLQGEAEIGERGG